MAAVDAKAINIYMSVTGPYSAQIARKGAETQAFGNQANAGFAKAQSGAARFGATASKIALGGAVAIAAGLALSAKAAINFESSFAGVRKTVETTEAGFELLSNGIRKMATEIPVGVNELNRITELGGQLGVGADDLLEFTDVIAKIGVTTTLSTEEAATGFARLDNIMGLGKNSFEEMGSTIVDLGNNFAATEDEILNFALRVAPIGATIGLHTDEVLAIATAFTSVGVRAERGGTAIQKTFIEIAEAAKTGGEELAIFARVAGLTQTEFSDLVDIDPAAAFDAFITGLGKINAEGGNAFATLDSLHLGNSRVVQSLLAMANASGVLTDALDMGEDAWRESVALAEEAEKRFGTTASQLLILKGNLIETGIGIGTELLPFVNDFIGGLTTMVDWVLKLNPEMKLLAGVIGGVGLALIALGTGHPALIAVTAVAAAIGWIGRRAAKAEARVDALRIALEGMTPELDLDAIFGPDVVNFWERMGFSREEISEAISGTEAEMNALADRMDVIFRKKGSGAAGLIGEPLGEDIFDVRHIKGARDEVQGLHEDEAAVIAQRINNRFVYLESLGPDFARQNTLDELRERYDKVRGSIPLNNIDFVVPAILSPEQLDDVRDAVGDYQETISEAFDAVEEEIFGSISLLYEFGDAVVIAWDDVVTSATRQMEAKRGFEQFFIDNAQFLTANVEKWLRDAWGGSPEAMEGFLNSVFVDPVGAWEGIRFLRDELEVQLNQLVTDVINADYPNIEFIPGQELLAEMAGIVASVKEDGQFDAISAWKAVLLKAQAEMSPADFAILKEKVRTALADPAMHEGLGVTIDMVGDLIDELDRLPANVDTTVTVTYREIGKDEYLGSTKGITQVDPNDKRSAFGGNISALQPTLVGELGPEIFVPFNSGTIIPNSKLGGGGDTEYNLNVYGSTDAGNDGAAILLTAQMIGKL